MGATPSEKQAQNARAKVVPTISATLDDGALVELIYDPHERRTRFAIWRDGAVKISDTAPGPRGTRLVPYAPDNNLIKHGVVLFAREPTDYGSDEVLFADLLRFIHRYVDVPPRIERIACSYVLLSWVCDRFNELPYLRLRGDYGSGKTRFLLTVGSLCYKPIFASGASSTSPLFRILDAFGGTLIIDEGDFRFSDEKADIIKILNGGNVRGMPLLKTEVSKSGEFNPRAFDIFGPKLVATRGPYQDRALESRFITHQSGGRALRADVPINLPNEFREEAQALRNKLLLYRFRHWDRAGRVDGVVDPGIEPRLNQVFAPLLSVVENESLRAELREMAREHHRELVAERGMDVEAQVLAVIRDLSERSEHGNLPIKDITAAFAERHAAEHEHAATNQWIGALVRRKLGLRTHKSHGNYGIPLTERPKLNRLFERYGLSELRVDPVEAGDAAAEQGRQAEDRT